MILKGLQAKHILRSILSTFEANYNQKIPNSLNCIATFLFLIQPLSYIIKLEYRQSWDEIMQVYTKLIYYLNMTHILFFFETMLLKYLVLFIIFAIFFLFIFTFVLNLFETKKKLRLKFLVKKLNLLNQICQTIAYFFPSLAFIPICEFFALLVENKTEHSLIGNTTVYMIISILGWTLTIFFSLAILLMCHSFIFLDNMILRIDLNIYTFFHYFCKMLLILFWNYTNDLPSVRFLLIIVQYALLLFDYFRNFLISHPFLSQFYISVLISCTTISCIFSIDNYIGIFSLNDMIYLMCIGTLLSIKLALYLYNVKHKNIMLEDILNSNRIGHILENLYTLFDKKFNEESNFIFHGLFILHYSHSEKKFSELFKAKTLKEFESLNYIKKEEILKKFINTIFFIHLKKISSRKKEINFRFYILFLKYCTFLEKIGTNPLKNYYDVLKLVLLLDKNHYYFKAAYSKILNNIKVSVAMKDIQNRKNEGIIQVNKLNLNTFFQMLKEKTKLNRDMQFILKKKIDFFERFKESINSYDEFAHEIEFLHKPVNEFSLFLKKMMSKEEDSLNKVFLFKFQAILNCVVLNNINEGIKMEDQLEKFRLKEISLENELNGNSFFSDNMVTMQTSFLQGVETIIETSKNHRLAKFFGFKLEEFNNVKAFGILMPEIIRKSHLIFVNNYINSVKLQKKRINNEFHSFALNKEQYLIPIRIHIGLSTSFKYDFIYNAAIFDIGLRNEKSILFQSSGHINGFTKMFHEFFQANCTDIIREKYNLINIFGLMLNLKDNLSKNNFWLNDNNNLINQTTVFSIPENLEEIINILALKLMEENSEKQNSHRYITSFGLYF